MRKIKRLIGRRRQSEKINNYLNLHSILFIAVRVMLEVLIRVLNTIFLHSHIHSYVQLTFRYSKDTVLDCQYHKELFVFIFRRV
jgi:hypothetical protein